MRPAQLGVFLYRLSRLLYFWHLTLFAKAVKLLMMYVCSMEIDFRTKIGAGFRIYHGFGVVIGGGEIGINVHVNQGVTIGGNWGKSRGDVTCPVIGNNVWIMSNSLVLGPIIIGDNVLIGANSVVTSDVPNNTLFAGSPAKFIRNLSEQDIALLSAAGMKGPAARQIFMD
jgi:serine acetyltransferase